MKAQKNIEKPAGLSVIRLFTIIPSVFFTLIFYVIIVRGGSFRFIPALFWFMLFLGIYGFIIVFSINRKKTLSWYTANIYWIISIFFLAFFGVEWFYYFGHYDNVSYIAFSLGFAYYIGCLGYFQTRQIKKYFTLAKEAASHE